MQHISGYNDLMNETFITDLTSTWKGQGWRFMGLPILIPASPSIPPLGTFPIAVSYGWRAFWQFQPHKTLLLLAVTLHSSSPVGGTGSTVSVCCARTALPPLAHPAFHLFLLQIHASLWSWVSRSWKDEHAKYKAFFYFLILSQGLGLGFFRGLLYLWVESCDSVTVPQQCYKLLHRWWLYQLGVFHIHAAFCIKGVGIGSHL